MRHSHHSHKTGFTLVEVLVAVSILAIVAALSWRGLDAVLHSNENTQRQFNQLRSISTFFDQIQLDFDYSRTLSYYLPAVALSKDNSVRFIRVSALDTTLQVVKYRLNQEGELLRGISQPLQIDALSAIETIPLQWQNLMQNVKDFQVLAYQTERNTQSAISWQPLATPLEISDELTSNYLARMHRKPKALNVQIQVNNTSIQGKLMRYLFLDGAL